MIVLNNFLHPPPKKNIKFFCYYWAVMITQKFTPTNYRYGRRFFLKIHFNHFHNFSITTGSHLFSPSSRSLFWSVYANGLHFTIYTFTGRVNFLISREFIYFYNCFFLLRKHFFFVSMSKQEFLNEFSCSV